MNHVRGPKLNVRGQEIVFDLLWIGPALLLSIPTGWALTGIVLDAPSVGIRLLSSAIAPLTALLAIYLHARSIAEFTPSGHSATRRRSMLYAGHLPSGYFTEAVPTTEFRRELRLTGLLTVLGTLIAVSVIVLDPGTLLGPLLIQGVIVALVGIMQILPAIPFHGGYLFRSIFWYFHSSFQTGTRAAFLYGQLVGSAGIGFGAFFLMWGTNTILPGLWCLFLGVLVLRASRAEILRVTLIDRSKEVLAADAIAGLNPTIRASATVSEALDILLEQKENGPALVRDRTEYAGMLDLEMVRAVPRSRWFDTSVADVAFPFDELVDSEPGGDLLDVLRQVDQQRGAVIVREANGEIVGLVDSSLDPRSLLRRGVARNLRRAMEKQTTNKSEETS